MKRNCFFQALLFAAAAVSVFAAPDSGDSKVKAAFSRAGITLQKVRQKAPDFSVTRLENGKAGKTATLADFRGKTLVLNFWASWCPPCRAEMPSMETFFRQFQGKNLDFLAVDLMEDSDSVSAFLKRGKYTFSAAIDEKGAAAASYGVEAIPTTIIIAPDGTVLARFSGSRDWSGKAMTAAFEALLGE